MIHMKHLKSNSKDDSIVEKSYMLILKHVNEASTYLKYQKDFQTEQTFKTRQASVYYLLGVCYRILKNNEMELEMFANSLDLYENLIPTDDKIQVLAHRLLIFYLIHSKMIMTTKPKSNILNELMIYMN